MNPTPEKRAQLVAALREAADLFDREAIARAYVALWKTNHSFYASREEALDAEIEAFLDYHGRNDGYYARDAKMKQLREQVERFIADRAAPKQMDLWGNPV